MCEIKKLLKEVQKSIDSFNKDREPYFHDIKGNERSVVFRIAHELAKSIEGNKEFPNIYVDIEPRRCNQRPKTNPTTNHPMTPDVIIHNRGGKGYIAMEFKCETPPTDDDKIKLQLLTTPREKRKNLSNMNRCPKYEVGIMVHLKNVTTRNNEPVSYIYYMDGNEISEKAILERI